MKYGMLNGMVIKKPISFRNEDLQNLEQGPYIPDEVDDDSIPVDSTAIESARYEPSDDSLNITYKGGGKEYKFKANGSNGLEEWVHAPSKGRITQEWRYTHRYPGY